MYFDDLKIGKAVITNLTKRNEKNGIVEIEIEAYNQKGEMVFTNVTEAIAS